MKKLHLAICMFIALGISVSSCKKETSEDPTVEPITLECNAFRSNNANKITRLEDRSSDIDYIITCRSVVDVDLVIEPGVTIAFATDAGLEIVGGGSLNAKGSAGKKIVFTSKEKVKGSWAGILIRSNDVKNRLEHCEIAFAGGAAFNSNNDRGNVILWSGSGVALINTAITDGANYGINANYQDYNVDVTNCTITRCDMPVYANANLAHRITGGSFTGNTTDAIRVRGDNGSRAIKTNQTWTNLGIPYRVASTSDNLRINEGTLTLLPGVTIEFETGQGMRIGDNNSSALIANGTATEKITFTGVDKVAGAWSNIYFSFTSSPLNSISHAVVEYAGSGSKGAVYMWAKPVVNASNILFRNILSTTCAFYSGPNTSNPNTNLSKIDITLENVPGGESCGD